jgi:sulfate adenylyltransferase subunit 1 (EFTu-like GTPase family)
MFNNGLQLLGTVEGKDEAEKAIVLSKPVQLVLMPNQDSSGKPGQVNMAFAPFLQYTEEWSTGVKFVVSDILTVATPQTELVNSYNQTFGSGLIVPPGLKG